tara:strand:+ start:1965 stop:2069 length:105 start_codon:yes stop_codon:yes gene_type:complete
MDYTSTVQNYGLPAQQIIDYTTHFVYNDIVDDEG